MAKKLEDVLKTAGYSDTDLAALEPLLKDGKFRTALETSMGADEEARLKAERESAEWSTWHQNTAIPTLDKYMGDAEKARTDLAQANERLKIAQERGLLRVAEQSGEPEPVRPAAGGGEVFDPKKYNLVDESRITQLADIEGDAIAAANDLSAEHWELFGKPLTYTAPDGSKGFRALRREAIKAGQSIDQYVRGKFKFDERRGELAAQAKAEQEKLIRQDERQKVLAETVNPMLRPPSSSVNPFGSKPATVKDGGQPWDSPESRKQDRLTKAVTHALQA